MAVVGHDVFGDVGKTEGAVLCGYAMDSLGAAYGIIGPADDEEGEAAEVSVDAQAVVAVATGHTEQIAVHRTVSPAGEAEAAEGIVVETADVLGVAAEPSAAALRAEGEGVGRGEGLDKRALVAPSAQTAHDRCDGECAAGEEGVVPPRATDDGAVEDVGMQGEVAAQEEGAHGVAHGEVGHAGPTAEGFLADEVDVGYDDVGSIVAIAEVAAQIEGVKPAGAFAHLTSGETVAEMVMADDGPAARHEETRQNVVAVNVFLHAMDELQDAARRGIGGLPHDVVKLLSGVGGGKVVVCHRG